jgi:hypothetical protein
MKLLFLMISLFACLFAVAQTTSIQMPKEKIDELNRILKERKITEPRELHAFFDSLIKDITPTENSSAGIFSLPQDNMPCIVPDMNKSIKIPNGMTPRIPFKTEIPNAAPQQKLNPKKLKWKPVYINNPE